MICTIWSRNSWRWVYRSTKSICLPTVLSASENLALNRVWSVSSWLARAVPMAWATWMTSSTVLLTRTKNVMRMSARMLSRQISPSAPERSISMVFTEMSITSALCRIGSTIAPVNVTCTFLIFETISTCPCSTLRNSLSMTMTPANTSRMAASSTPSPMNSESISGSLLRELDQRGERWGSSSASYGITQKNSPSAS